MQPVLLNLVENPGTVQWIHRIFGTVLTLLVIGLWIRTQFTNAARAVGATVHLLLGFILLQYTLGVFTVLLHVPLALGIAHQAVAMLSWISWLMFYHRLKKNYYHILSFRSILS